MKKIGIISDTHGTVENRFLEFFEGCDEIWHAGDIGNYDVILALQAVAPVVRAVYGNIDGWDLRSEFPEVEKFKCENKTVWLKHICGRPGRYEKDLREKFATERPDILVCGHSHILRVEYDKKYNFLFINPGAAGNSGFHKVKTAVRFVIDSDDLRDLKVLEVSRKK